MELQNCVKHLLACMCDMHMTCTHAQAACVSVFIYEQLIVCVCVITYLLLMYSAKVEQMS